MATTAKGEQSRWSGYFQIILVLGVVAVALYLARSLNPIGDNPVHVSTGEEATPTVYVVRPEPTREILRLSLTGSVGLAGRLTVRSEVRGRVVWTAPSFRDGGDLAADEVFVRLDPARYEFAVEAAQGRVDAAQAALALARAAETATTAGAEPGSETPPVAAVAAELRVAQAALAVARADLEATRIALPFPTRVLEARAEPGEFVGLEHEEARAVALLYRPDRIRVRAAIAPDDLTQFAPVTGRKARIEADGRSWDAEVTGTTAAVAPRSRLAAVFLSFSADHPPEDLPLPGTFAEIEILGPAHDNVFVLPESALQDNGTVWVIREGQLARVAPETVAHTATGWVVAPFDPGDGVMTGTLPGAREGLAVRVSPPPSAR